MVSPLEDLWTRGHDNATEPALHDPPFAEMFDAMIDRHMPIGELDLRRVRYFVAVAEELHFRRAAERLFISQPSLSQQVRRLEAELGASLLSRGSRRVELTESGEAFLREARQLLAQAERTQAAARLADKLVVGFTGSAGAGLLPSALARFATSSPSTTVVVRELDLGHLEAVVDGSVDIAFTRLQPGHAELHVEVLLREDRVVALAADHPLAKRPSIAFADLRDEPFITASASWDHAWRDLWRAERSRHGLRGPVVAEVTSVEEIVALVASKRGVSIMPATNADLYPRPGLVYVRVEDAEPALLALVWRQGSGTPLLQNFIFAAKGSARGSI